MTVERAREGETLDALAWRTRRLGAADLHAVLEVNPGLAAHGAILPAGTPVTFPEIAQTALPVRGLVQLWD